MDKIKPYLFWVVCGVILVIELAVMAIMRPPPPAADAPKTAAEAKAQFEQQLSSLENLTERADRTITKGVGSEFIDPVDAKRKLQQFIITKAWEAPLKAEVEERRRLLVALREELAQRSAFLSDPVSTQGDAFPWYTEYARVSGALLEDLAESGLVEVPEGLGDSATGASGYETNPDLRGRIGLETAPNDMTQWQDPERRATASRNFRIIERITRLLAGVEAVAETNPRLQDLPEGLPEIPAPEPQGVVLRRLTFSEQSGNRRTTNNRRGTKPSGDLATYRIRLELVGSPAALMEAMRAIDALGQPVAVRLGARWTRNDRFDVGGKHGRADVPMKIDTELVILDFSGLAAGQPGG